MLAGKESELTLFEDNLQFRLVLQIQPQILEAAPNEFAELKGVDCGQRKRDIRLMYQRHSL